MSIGSYNEWKHSLHPEIDGENDLLTILFSSREKQYAALSLSRCMRQVPPYMYIS